MTVLAMTDPAPRAQHHASARRRGRAGCAEKHAFAPRGFCRDRRRPVQPGKPQVGSGVEAGSHRRIVGVSCFYDPTTGQFISRDPLNAMTRSAYGYVYGNPLNSRDPSGMGPFGFCIHNPFGGDDGCNTIADSGPAGRGVQIGAGAIAVGALGVACVASGVCEVAAAAAATDCAVDGCAEDQAIVTDAENELQSLQHGADSALPEFCDDASHMFRDAPGHLAVDNAANRALLQGTAANPSNLMGTYNGVSTYTQLQADGSQVWVEMYGGKITNGGVNELPRVWNGSKLVQP